MLSRSIDILAISRFIPHGHCYLWQTNLVWLHVTSDLLIAIAYYSISVTLLYFVSQRVDLPYPRVFFLFAAFIFCCGTTHLMEIWTLRYPNYWISGTIKAIAALISLDTAIEIVPFIPKMIALPSPTQLKQVNQQLEREITKHKQTEIELKQSEKRYRAIVEDQTEFVVRFDCNGTLIFVNDAYCRYFNQKEAEIVGKSYQSLVHPEDRNKRSELLNSLNPKNPVGYVEYRVVVDEEIRWMGWSYRKIFDEQKNLVDLQSVGRDIGDRVGMERALQKRESILRGFYESAPMMMGIVKIVDDKIIPISCNKTATEFFASVLNTAPKKSEKITNTFAETFANWNKYFYDSQFKQEPVYFEYCVRDSQEEDIFFSVTKYLCKINCIFCSKIN
ncbi:PAS domain S-box protein [Waterburya agarophytonicola K14]|uniref:PAS domain S-box protein n=1 Tax=Waterburya agarophytonicola KI4 TaxID=2874699 RepID=A0A964BTH3_9CYAN|nr:PAS domain S-box protein [Waterburya agarophytonicola]MCC0179509.1 PAS domain S-box protein [Waterburya agarophytonicola KI4]